MATKTQTTQATVTDIIEVQQGVVTYCIVGESPLVCNSMANKALHELLLPRGRKNAAERATTLKHDPVAEFRSSILRIGEDEPTLIALPATAFKGTMKTAALDLPGVTKTQIGRLVYVIGENVPIYGVPELYMAVVRSADINKTPDVRTRAILPRWACAITVGYVEPLVRPAMISRLLAAGGMSVGVGDGRPEKGTLSFGRFKIVSPDDLTYQAIVASGGRAAQLDAMEKARPYDEQTSSLLTWFDSELDARKLRGAA